MAGFLYVGAGGALGAALRYAISLLPYKGLFPALTLITNVLGAAAIGCIAGVAARRGGHEQAGAFPENRRMRRLYQHFRHSHWRHTTF